MTAPRIVPIAEAQALFGRGTKDELAAAAREVQRLSASRDRWRVAAGKVADTMCPECGPAVEVDEDGCCIGCGNGAMGTYVVELADRLRAAEAADRDAMFREVAP
jgi:hypothetical protein